MPFLVVGTAGHIDHGKSALVCALTGIDPDRLKEEKRRGITIELGFADLTLDGGRVLSFVDVPGHERFVRNMLAGAGGIDAAVLVIAADEMDRMREYLLETSGRLHQLASDHGGLSGRDTRELANDQPCLSSKPIAKTLQ